MLAAAAVFRKYRNRICGRQVPSVSFVALLSVFLTALWSQALPRRALHLKPSLPSPIGLSSGLKPQHALGHDVALNLVGAAIDRRGTAEVHIRYGADCIIRAGRGQVAFAAN